MTQFYIVEIQQYANGEYGHLVHYAFDQDADVARLKAESKYHEVLAAAAISNTMSHAAILFSTEGFPIMHQCYKHQNVQQTPAADTGDEPAEPETPEEPTEEPMEEE